MLDKVIEREASIVTNKMKVKNALNNVIIIRKGPPPGTPKKQRYKKDYKWLPKYTHTYVER